VRVPSVISGANSDVGMDNTAILSIRALKEVRIQCMAVERNVWVYRFQSFTCTNVGPSLQAPLSVNGSR
jgi:hypothetical protein